MAPKTPRTPQNAARIQIRAEWKTCAVCLASFAARDALKHEALCSVVASKELVSANDINHGLVWEKKLYSILEENGCRECLQIAVKVQASHIILISPSAMQLCGVSIGAYVLVESDAVCSTFIAWPCSHIPPTSFVIDSAVLKVLKLDTPKGLRISAIPETERKPAPFLRLELVTELTSMDSTTIEIKKLEEAFLHQFDGHVIRPGVFLVLKHLGRKWAVRVVDSNDGMATDKLSLAMKALTVDAEPTPDYYSILSSTRISFIEANSKSASAQASPKLGLTDFGGGHDVLNEIKRMCSSVFQQASDTLYTTKSPRGLLLYGPSGTGKSLLVRAIANHFGVGLVTVHGAELFSKFYGETETRLREKFDEAIQMDKCIVMMDEIDTLCPRRTDVNGSSSSGSDQERRVVAALLSTIDSIPPHSRLVIMGITNRPDALDPALRRPGRLDRELELRAPTSIERREILDALLREVPHRLSEKDLNQLASVTHGFVGADLSLLCSEASLAAAKRSVSSHSESENAMILSEDAKAALHLVKPSAMREVLVEVPDVRWTDIGGQEELKLKLRQAVEWPLRYPEAFQRLGVEPPRGLLMFGPPGCSKTMIAKALATESGLNFIAVKGPELFSKWVGESERAVREVFRRARQVAPAIVFLDELDALGSARGGGSGGGVGDRVLAQLLTEMDGIEALKDVTVVAATNRPDMIDKALLRPGRLDRIVYVPLPDEATRREILQLKFNNMPIHSEVELDWLVDSTPGYSGAEVSAICNEAALRALEEDIQSKEIRRRHFDFALSVITPRITAETVNFYERYVQESGMHAI